MKRAILERLEALPARGGVAALVTELASGNQALIEEGKVTGELALGANQLTLIADMIAADRTGVIDGTQLFVRVYAAPTRLIIVGAVHIAQSLAPMAQLAGFKVIVVDPRAAFMKAGGFQGVDTIEAWPDEAFAGLAIDARTAVVTLTHDPKLDDPALTSALKSDAFYIGALGSRKTHAKRIERLREAGCSEASLARIHGPVGLDIDAESPAEIAVSIMAQVIQTLRRGGGEAAP